MLKRPEEWFLCGVSRFTWVIIHMLIATGIRATELRELKIGNVDLVNRLFEFRALQKQKTSYDSNSFQPIRHPTGISVGTRRNT